MAPSFVIEKGIPVPPRPEFRDRSGRRQLRDWASLEIGDSVRMPTRAAAATAFAYGYRHGRSFQSEKRVEDDGWRGWRVWRTA